MRLTAALLSAWSTLFCCSFVLIHLRLLLLLLLLLLLMADGHRQSCTMTRVRSTSSPRWCAS